ncbi:LSM domain-containing protein [uncultured Methanobrevibacter sp.]|uniref:LSM domain-containing protein n=1 Tax=uncultured Methanobrevibacter sp. TaxID=253161 RepID=UPI0025D3B80D|nr:LSM domain-containing protein [uncultured Methanobrevibacter sp.]
MANNNFQVNKDFIQFKGKNVLIGLKNTEEYSGKVISIDNFLNTVLEVEDGIKVIKGGKIAFISIQ